MLVVQVLEAGLACKSFCMVFGMTIGLTFGSDGLWLHTFHIFDQYCGGSGREGGTLKIVMSSGHYTVELPTEQSVLLHC